MPTLSNNLVFHSKSALRLILFLFYASLIMDVDIIGVPILIGRGIVDPQSLGTVPHLLLGGVEIVAIICGTLLWLLMLYSCIRWRGRSILWRALWFIAFFAGIWWTAQIFYLVQFRRITPEKRVAVDVSN